MLFNLRLPLPPQPRDPYQERAEKVVKDWLRSMMQGRIYIDEYDAPIVQFTPQTCEAIANDIAAALRDAAQGRL